MDSSRSSLSDEQYELLREDFLANLRRGRMMWTPTRTEFDKDVEISRIFRSNPNERIAVMRIRPGGFRASRRVPSDTKLIFDAIWGRVSFLYKGKTRVIHPEKSCRITIAPKMKYSARSLEVDQPVYLLVQVIDVEPSSPPRLCDSTRLAILPEVHQSDNPGNEESILDECCHLT